MLLRKSNKGNHTIFLFVCFNYLLCQILNGIFSKLIVSPPLLSSYNIILLTKSMLGAWRQPSLDLCSIQPSGWSPAPSSSPPNWGYYFRPCRGYIPRCISLLRKNIVPKQINLLVRIKNEGANNYNFSAQTLFTFFYGHGTYGCIMCQNSDQSRGTNQNIVLIWLRLGQKTHSLMILNITTKPNKIHI